MKLRLQLIWIQVFVIGVLSGTNSQTDAQFVIFSAPNSELTVSYPVRWFVTMDSPNRVLVSNIDSFDWIKQYCYIDALYACELASGQQIISFELIRKASLVNYGLDIQSEISPFSIVSKIALGYNTNSNADLHNSIMESFSINGRSAASIETSVQSLIILEVDENLYAKVIIYMESIDLQEFEPTLMSMLESLRYVPPPGINIPLEQITAANANRLTLLSTVSTNQPILDMSFSRNSDKLITVGENHATAIGMYIWNLTTGEILVKSPMRIYLARYSPDGNTIGVVRYAEPFDITIWDASLRQSLWYVTHVPFGKGVNVTIDLVFSPNGKRFAFSTLDYKIHLWDNSKLKQEIAELNGHTQGSIKLAFSPNAQLLASISWFGNDIRLWNAATGASIGVLPVDSVSELTFSPDSRFIAAVTASGILLFDVDTEQTVFTLPSLDAQVIRFLPTLDEPLLAIYNEMKGDLSIRNMSTGSSLFNIQAQYMNKEGIGYIRTQFAVSPNGKLLATGTQDVHIWGVPALQ